MKQFIAILLLSVFFLNTYAQEEDDLHWGYDFINYTVEDGLPSNETYSIVQDNDGYLWISSDNGVSRYNGYEFENFTIEDGLIDNTIFRMFKDEKGRIWMPGYNGKLCYYENGKFVPYEFNYVLDSLRDFEYTDNIILEMYVDDNNTVFVNYTIGFLSLDSNGVVRNIIKKEKLDETEYVNLLIDKSKEFLVKKSTGTHKIFLKKKNNSIKLDYNIGNLYHQTKYYKHNRMDLVQNYFGINNVFKSLNFHPNSFIVSKESLWFLTSKGVYYKKIKNDKYFRILDKYSFSTGFIDKNGGLWLASLNNGIFYMPNDNLKILYNKSKKIDEEQNVFSDSLGNQILILKNNKYNLKKENIFNLRDNTVKNLIFKNIFDIEEKIIFHKTINNSTFIGTLRGAFLITNNILKIFDNSIVLNSRVQAIDVIGNDTILGIKGKGIVILRKDSFIQFKKENGLLSNSINNFFKDKNNKLWIATSEGLNSLTYNKENSKYYINSEITKFEGLLNNKIKTIFIQEGYAYIGTSNGLYLFNFKEANNKVSYTNKVLIKKIRVNGKTLDIVNNYFSNKENNFNFEYEVVSFPHKGEITYRYKMNGLFEKWQFTNKRMLSFYKLPPNKYKFEIQYQLPDMNWSGSTFVDFSIKKPFWKTWWFRILSILLIILVFSFLFIDYSNRKKLELDFFKSSQTALASQMNPHFVFNAMNSLQNYMLKNENDLAQKYLIKFSRLIRIVFENSKENYISLSNELSALNLYLELEKKRFDNKFEYEIELNVKDDVFVPPLIIQPFVENAIWHGLMHINTNGILKIKIEKEKTKLKISISDNGIGIEKSKALKSKSIIKTKKSSGISNSKKRIKLLEKQYKTKLNFELSQNCKDCENVGTLVVFELPLFYKNPQV